MQRQRNGEYICINALLDDEQSFVDCSELQQRRPSCDATMLNLQQLYFSLVGMTRWLQGLKWKDSDWNGSALYA